MSRIRMTEQTAPATPPANTMEIYPDTADSKLKVKKDDGSVVDLEAGGGVSDHGALTGLADDDHTQYQLRSEKNAVSGYAGLDGSSKLTGSQQVYGTLANTACVGNDARLSDARTPLAHTHPIADLTDDGALAALNTVGTAQIDNDSVTYAKLQNVSATDRVLGRVTAGAGDAEEIACTAAGRALIDDADASAQRTTLGLGALATLATVGSSQIDDAAVTYAKVQDVSAASRLLGRGSAAGAGDVQEITIGSGLTLTGTDLTASASAPGLNDLTDVTLTTPATGAVLVKSAGDWIDGQVDLADADAVTGELGTANIANAAVTYAKVQDVSAASRLLGRGSAGGAGDVEEITIGSGLTLTGTSLTASAAAPALDDLTDVTLTSPATNSALIYNGSIWIDGLPTPASHTHALADITDDGALAALNTVGTTQIDNDAVTYAKLQNVAGFSVVGKATTGAGDAADITAADETVLGRTGAGNLAFAQVATGQIANDAVTYAKLQNVAGFSVIGKAATGSGDAADISASADGQVLRRAGGSVGFGAVDLADTDAVTGTLPAGNLPSTVVLEDQANTWTTGAQDMGGATSFEVPNGAGGTTVDAAGEVCVDTTSRTLNFYDGTAEVVLNPVHGKSFLLEAPVAADDLPIYRFDVASTLVKVVYAITGGTNWVGQMREADDAQGTNVADTQSADSTVTGNTTVTSFTNASFDAGDYIRIGTTSVSGSVTWLHVSFYFRENA